MFGKSSADNDPQPEARPSARPKAQVAKNGRTVLGPTVVFKGELSADEDLVIEGRIEGSIHHHNKNLTIGPRGTVKADINARVITVEGTVVGNLLGDEAVVIRSGGMVTGNAQSPRIILEDGAKFNGKIETTSAKAIATGDSDRGQGLPKYAHKKAG